MSAAADGPNQPAESAALIATLGTEPQVVTATLDLLLARGYPITTIRVVHTVSSDPQIQAALQDLKDVFERAVYPDRFQVHFDPLIDSNTGKPLPDVESPEAAADAFRLLYRLVLRAKRSGYQVHLSIAGGRKTLAVYGMATAQLLFDEGDRLWHLYSAGDFLASRRLHPEEGDQVHLIQIPVVHWSRISPVMMDLGKTEDPFEALERAENLRLAEKIELARSFVLGSLTPAEARVVLRLARDGLSDRQMAEELSVSPRTVEQHLRSAYRKAAAHWDLADVDRTQLTALLNLYFSTQYRGYPE